MVSDPTELSCTSPEYRIVSDPAELLSRKYCCNPVRVSVVVEVELVAAVAVVEVVAVVVAAVSVMVDTVAVGVAAVVLAAAAALAVAVLAAAAALLRLLAAVLAAAIPTTNLEAFLFWTRRQPTAMPTLPRTLTVNRRDMTTTSVLSGTVGGHSGWGADSLGAEAVDVSVSDGGRAKTLTGRAHLGAQAPRSSRSRDVTVLTTGTRSLPMMPTLTGMLFAMSNFWT